MGESAGLGSEERNQDRSGQCRSDRDGEDVALRPAQKQRCGRTGDEKRRGDERILLTRQDLRHVSDARPSDPAPRTGCRESNEAFERRNGKVQ